MFCYYVVLIGSLYDKDYQIPETLPIREKLKATYYNIYKKENTDKPFLFTKVSEAETFAKHYLFSTVEPVYFDNTPSLENFVII